MGHHGPNRSFHWVVGKNTHPPTSFRPTRSAVRSDGSFSAAMVPKTRGDRSILQGCEKEPLEGRGETTPADAVSQNLIHDFPADDPANCPRAGGYDSNDSPISLEL